MDAPKGPGSQGPVTTSLEKNHGAAFYARIAAADVLARSKRCKPSSTVSNMISILDSCIRSLTQTRYPNFRLSLPGCCFLHVAHHAGSAMHGHDS